MPEINLPLSDWNPDASTLNTQGINNASNIFPTSSGYRTSLKPIKAFTDLPEGSEPIAAYTAEFFDKSKTNFIAYKKADGTYTIDIIGKTINSSAVDDGVLQLSDTSKPRFSQFGDNVYCTHEDTLLKYTPGSGKFTEVTDAPTAKYITVSDNFLIVAYTSESSSDNPLKIQWSGLNDPDQWDSTASGSQAGEQVITGLGEIKNVIATSQSITILLDRGIVRGTYIAGPIKWNFNTLENEVGCYVPDSVISVGPSTYFLSYEGFVRFNGTQIQAIGQNRVDEYIINHLDRSRLHEVSVTYDKNYDVINWLIPSNEGGKEIIHYNTKLDKWGKSDTDVSVIGIFKPVGENVDTIGKQVDDPTLPNTDSLSFVGGTNDLYVGLRGNEILTFNGAEGTSSLRTHEFQFASNVLVTDIEISGTSRNAKVSVEYRNNLASNYARKSSVLNNYNRAGVRAEGKYFRFGVDTDGGFNATGMKIIYKSAGAR